MNNLAHELRTRIPHNRVQFYIGIGFSLSLDRILSPVTRIKTASYKNIVNWVLGNA